MQLLKWQFLYLNLCQRWQVHILGEQIACVEKTVTFLLDVSNRERGVYAIFQQPQRILIGTTGFAFAKQSIYHTIRNCRTLVSLKHKLLIGNGNFLDNITFVAKNLVYTIAPRDNLFNLGTQKLIIRMYMYPHLTCYLFDCHIFGIAENFFRLKSFLQIYNFYILKHIYNNNLTQI